MAETWINAKLYINDGSGGERLVHYETNTKQIIDFNQAVNEIINNAFEGTVLRGTTTLENLHVTGTSQLDGPVTCNDITVNGTIFLSDDGTITHSDSSVKLSKSDDSYIEFLDDNGWKLVNKSGDTIISTLSSASDGNLTYDKDVVIQGTLKVNGNIISPIKLHKATITSDDNSTKIQSAYNYPSSVSLLANGNVEIKAANNHTLLVKNDGLVTIDGESLLTKTEMMNLEHPVGSVYITLTDTNPNTILGVGTWMKIGQGLQLAIAGSAKDSNDTNHTFAAGVNAGEWSHGITAAEMAKHGHKVTCNGAGGHDHTKGNLNITGWFGAYNYNTAGGAFYGVSDLSENIKGGGWSSSGIRFDANRCPEWVNGRTSGVGDHTHGITIGESGSNLKHNNITPSFAIYLWTRTA